MSIMSVEELQTALQSATQRCEAQRTALRTLYTELQEHTTKFDAIYIPPPRSLDLLHTISAALSNTSVVPSSTVRQQGRTQYSQNVGTPLPESLNKDSNGNNEEGNGAPRPRAGEAGLVPSASHRSSSQLSCPHSAAAAAPQQQQQPRPSTSSRRSLSLTSSLNGLHGQSQAAPGTTQLRNNEPPRSASQRSVAHSSSYGGVIQPRPAQQEQRVHQPSSTHASSSAGIHPISPWIINSEASQAQEEEKPVSRVADSQQQQQLPSVKTQDSLAESKKGEEEEFVVPSIVKSSRDEAREAVAAEMQAYNDAQRQEEEEQEHKAVQNNETQRAGTPLRKYTATTKNNGSSTGSVNSSANPSATLYTANSNTSLSARLPSRHDAKLPSESTRPREPTCTSGEEEEARQFHTQPVIGSSSTPQERRMDNYPAIHSASTPAFYVAGTDEASEAAAQKARAAAAMQAVLNNNITTVQPQHAEEQQEEQREEGRNSPVRSLVDRSNEKLRLIQPGRQSSHASQNVSVHQTPGQQGSIQPVGIPSSYANHPASAQSVQQEEAENREPVAPNAAHVGSRSHSARSNGLNSTSNVSGGPRTTAAATQGGSADLSTPRRKRPISPLRRPREPGLTHHHGSQILVPAANETGATPKNINNNSSAAGVKQASPLPHSGTSPDVGPRAPALRSTPSSHASPNSQQLTVTKAQKDNSQPLSTRLVTQPPSAHALRTATPRRCVANGLDSGQIEKALYGGRVLQTGWPSHVVEDAPGVREFMEAEAERLQQREERDREARSPSLALLQQQQRHLAEQRSSSVGGNGRPRLSSGALIPVEDALQVTRAPPPSLTERQLLLERAQLANQLDKMFKEMVITMRRYDETGLEARYSQLNQRIARVQDDLKRVETEINVVQNLERKAQRRTISPF